MIAIKNWFLEKNDLRGIYGIDFLIIKETEKAMLLGYQLGLTSFEQWVPKSVIIDKWEKDTSNFGYHDYLVETCHKAYKAGKLFEQGTFKSGFNTYDNDSFLHQETTKELIKLLEEYNVKYMNRKEWNNREEF